MLPLQGHVLRLLRWNLQVGKVNLMSIYREKTALKYSCESGSGRIRIILPDPDPDQHPGHADPDRHPVQANVFSNTVYCPNIENNDTYQFIG